MACSALAKAARIGNLPWVASGCTEAGEAEDGPAMRHERCVQNAPAVATADFEVWFFAPSRFGLEAEGMTDLPQHGYNGVAEIAVVVIAVVQVEGGQRNHSYG